MISFSLKQQAVLRAWIAFKKEHGRDPKAKELYGKVEGLSDLSIKNNYKNAAIYFDVWMLGKGKTNAEELVLALASLSHPKE